MGDEARTSAASMMRSAVRRLAGQYPLHGRILSRAVWRPSTDTTSIALAATAEGFVIQYAPAYIASLNIDRCTGLLVHVINHVLFGHLTMTPEDFPDEEALTAAQEITANEWVDDDLLPPDAVTLEAFPELPPDEDTPTRYGRLSERSFQEDSPGTTDDHSGWTEAPPEMVAAVVRGGMADAFANLTPEERAALPEPVKQAVAKIVGKLAGHEAGGSTEPLDQPGRAIVRWQAVLRRFLASEPELSPTMSWPSRRAPDLVGIVPGTRRVAGRRRVMAVIDTSASLTVGMLTAISGELRGLSATADITIVQCDTEVHSVEPFKGKLSHVVGRGGTDLKPPFERGLLRRLRPDVLVYFTDGEGPAPSQPPRVPVLWCLTAEGRRPASWGIAVWMAA